ncbi:type III-A CRISPR-associated CARF protein Csm6 [Ligilactobacillus salivarius]|uniref:type III-A CRISPR-associated CARF protein Csm6 n=1 Tax=Ligilactobacillus salivarius TaxID=1624 RepID=UPI001E593E51|nr:CRISPR-associated protein Csm6 [Ligilactobacillus salivarius]MDE1506281.1 CRISPR-associated protein Csm6 [Ligilactobacillus salivarius]MDE1521062.1 CRISPR-associated protein Csm6 [Ligilactobacillus salivarius]
MTTLISCIGDTDPIRNRHDGALLHLVRVFRPKKILLIYSERALSKETNILLALNSIDGYNPMIEKSDEVISDSEVFIFDKMYEVLNGIISKYSKEDEDLILNLSSGTPQMKSALFTINRLKDINVKAYQVVTPSHSSNEGIKHDNNLDIDYLISTNLDNRDDFEKRILEDKAEKFQQTLIKRTMKDLLNSFDYESLYNLSTGQHRVMSKTKTRKLNSSLQDLTEAVKYQKLLKVVSQTKYSEKEKKLINSYLIILLQANRELVSEVLIRSKNIGEYACELYLEKNYPDLILWDKGRPYLNSINYPDIEDKLLNNEDIHYRKEQYLNIHFYIQILKELNENKELIENLLKLSGYNQQRNKVAHGLSEIPSSQVKVQKIVNLCYQVIGKCIDLKEDWSKFYDQFNNDISTILDE